MLEDSLDDLFLKWMEQNYDNYVSNAVKIMTQEQICLMVWDDFSDYLREYRKSILFQYILDVFEMQENLSN